jgi:hypothetical protein
MMPALKVGGMRHTRMLLLVDGGRAFGGEQSRRLESELIDRDADYNLSRP